mmetsp:Transcript_67203/g.165877  ORF Transcript_67203/g.165877 Transcript_67203/m.165877 type:complete len:83 (+) Transcript_67203:1337-1585(+)
MDRAAADIDSHTKRGSFCQHEVVGRACRKLAAFCVGSWNPFHATCRVRGFKQVFCVCIFVLFLQVCINSKQKDATSTVLVDL